MDVFWIIPLGIVTALFLIGFYVYINSRPLTPSDPQVLLDKPSDEPAVDEATKARDWSGRPCGAFLDWQRGK